MRLFKFIVIAIVSVLYIPGACIAAPSVSNVVGTVSDGQNIVISGSSLGTNSLDIQWLNPNIEAGTTDADVSLPAGWTSATTTADYESPIYSETKAHSGAKSIKSSTPDVDQYESFFYYDYGSDISSIYLSWWVYIENLACTGDCIGGSQWKIFRLTSGEDALFADRNESNFYLTQQVAAPTATFVGGNYMFYNFCLDDAASYDLNCYGGINPATNPGLYRPNGIIEGGWRRVEIWAIPSTEDTQDGTVIVNLFDGTNTITSYVDYDGDTRTRSSAYTWRYAVWQNYLGNGLDYGDIYIDDVFVQVGSQARVEIGDNATWANCTHREIQIPTVWAVDEITITVNQGSFENGTAYLFVVDSDGTASDGYPIQFGTFDGKSRGISF